MPSFVSVISLWFPWKKMWLRCSNVILHLFYSVNNFLKKKKKTKVKQRIKIYTLLFSTCWDQYNFYLSRRIADKISDLTSLYAYSHSTLDLCFALSFNVCWCYCIMDLCSQVYIQIIKFSFHEKIYLY